MIKRKSTAKETVFTAVGLITSCGKTFSYTRKVFMPGTVLMHRKSSVQDMRSEVLRHEPE